MANQIRISYLNPVRFYDANPAVFAQYLTRDFTDYRYRETLYPWEEKVDYIQKWQNSDTIKIQVESNFTPIQIDVISKKSGTSVVSLSLDLAIPNVGASPGFYLYEASLSFASLPAGCYHLRLSNGGPELHMISEPFRIAVKHANTLLLEYRNSKFFGDVLFETGITFSFRVEGAFDHIQPGADLQSYEDQKANPMILSARPFVARPLVFGGAQGIPDWAIHLLNLIWCCNDVKVDGKGYARSEDSSFSYEEIDDYPLRAAILQVREGNNRGSKISSPTLDPNMKLAVAFQIETNWFGGLAANSSSNEIPVITIE